MQPIPLLDLKAQYETIREEVAHAVESVLASQYFILGPEVKALEAEIADYVGASHGVGVSSGTDALLLALMILELEPGDEVITSAYSFFATAGSPARLGLKPVFVDIDPTTYNLDVAAVEAAITERTRVIIPVHLYGLMAEMDALMAIAEQHQLIVIEDAAQAIGARRNNQRAGSVGHMATFSFFPSKNLGGIGDGGMVTTQDATLAERLRLYRNHGYQPKYYNKVVGGNFRLDAIQAAVLRVKLRYLDKWTEARRRNAATYRRLFSAFGLALVDDDVSCLAAGCKAEACALKPQVGVVLPKDEPDHYHIYNQFVIRTANRDALQGFLQELGIGTAIYYPVPLHLQACFEDLGYEEGQLVVSECAALRTLALPIYPELTETQLETVVKAVAAFFHKEGNGALSG